MKTISIAPEEMATRLSRFAQLKPLPIQDDPNVPLEANDIVYARKLLSVISLESATDTPINAAAPIVGAGAMTMTMAVCPPGQGGRLSMPITRPTRRSRCSKGASSARGTTTASIA